MKKIKKFLAILSVAVMTFSLCAVQAFAAEKSVVWKNAKGKNMHTDSRIITYYDDGTFERVTTEFCNIVVTVPDGVEPNLEYFGVDRINDVSKFEDKFMYQTQYGEEVWSELEPGDNEYIIHMTLNGDQTVCELEDEATEIARSLMTEGKITGARVNHKVYKDTFNSISGIQILTNKDVESIGNPSDYPELAEGYNKNSSEFSKGLKVEGNEIFSSFTLDDNYDDKEICTNILSVCNALVENYDNIVSAEPMFPSILVSEADVESSYSAESIYMWGDISRDNSLDLHDAIEISKYIMGSSDLDEDTVLLADINRDGKTDIYDVIEIAKTLLS